MVCEDLIASALKMKWIHPLRDAEPVQSNYVAIVVGIDGDWPAYCKIMCLRLWNHSLWPCPCCDVTQLNILSLSNVTNNGGPWSAYSIQDYWTNVSQSQIVPRFSDAASVGKVRDPFQVGTARIVRH